MQVPISLVCPRCRGELTGPHASCEGCKAGYANGSDGILTFVQEGNRTKLDDMDYDTVYRVGRDASTALYRQCRSFLGGLMPREVDSFLEIGAGTGLFTLGFLAHTPTRHALVTDISRQMLVSCRERLRSEGLEAGTSVNYAMWDGEADCFRENTFDFVAGFSVLHHVLDYPSLLSKLCRSMRPGSRAIFLEPNLGFHRALVDFVTQVVWNVHPDDPAWSVDDRMAIYNWIGENHTNLKYCGDSFVLQAREDKHLFDGSKLTAVGRAAGFGSVRLVPFGNHNEAWTTVSVYANQLQLTDIARADLLKRCARMMPGQFNDLATEDRAPSVLIVLEKLVSSRALVPDPVVPAMVVALPDPNPSFRFQITFQVGAPLPKVEALGWILADVDVRFVLLDAGGVQLKFPVCGIRVDVDSAINSGRHFPPLRSLFPGLLNVCEQHLNDSDGCTAYVIAEGMDGRLHQLGSVELRPGESSSIEGHDVRPMEAAANDPPTLQPA